MSCLLPSREQHVKCKTCPPDPMAVDGKPRLQIGSGIKTSIAIILFTDLFWPIAACRHPQL